MQTNKLPYSATKASLRTFNPIRATIDTIVHPTHSDKDLISLSIGIAFRG